MPPEHEVPPVSAVTLRFFESVVRSYFRRHFRAVMVQQAERFAAAQGPLVVYANHSSWWDPMVSTLLARTLLPSRRHYAPMDADALKKYPILSRIGIFPVEMATARGAAQFLRTSQAILRSGGVLWVTPQGRFADAREAELGFKPGLAALAARVPEATILPLAIEYPFWNERLPETLLRFGPPVLLDPAASTEAINQRLESALAAEMLTLRQASCARDAKAFRVLLTGGRGTGGFYSLGRRLRALFGGSPVALDHTERG